MSRTVEIGVNRMRTDGQGNLAVCPVVRYAESRAAILPAPGIIEARNRGQIQSGFIFPDN